MSFSNSLEQEFRKLSDEIFADVKAGEDVVLNIDAEKTLYVRFNANHVRQNTDVNQVLLSLRLQSGGRSTELARTLTGHLETDLRHTKHLLATARKEILSLPEDPNQVAMKDNGHSHENFHGQLPSPTDLIHDIADTAEGSDLAGLYCGGEVISANRNSKGQNHWFGAESFFMDFSLYDGPKAAKGVLAGAQWDRANWKHHFEQTRSQLNLLAKPVCPIRPGQYRTYLAPGAISEILGLMAWGGLSSAAWKQGRCAFKKLADGERKLSKYFSVRENFELGISPRFNGLGEVAPSTVTLIENGEFHEFLTSARSEKEYGLRSNAAGEGEFPRSPEILPGHLEEKEILKELGTGLYLSNLHYLNWSDPVSARITGMTRYACFWVEKGEIQGPINDLRFDVSLYDVFGPQLIGLTKVAEIDPNVMTYGARALGGKKIPGALVDGFTFTL